MATDGSDHNRTVTYVALRPRVNPPPSQVGAWVQRETPVPLPPIPILRSNGPPREILSRVGSQAQKGPRAPIRDGDDGGDDDEDDGNNNYVGVNTIELRSGSLKRRNSSCHGSHDRKRLVQLVPARLDNGTIANELDMRVDATTEPFIDVVQPNAELINTDDKYEHVLLGMNPAFEVFDGTQGVPPPVLDHNVQPPGQPYRAGEGDDQNHGSYDADQAIIGFTGHDDDYQGQGTFLQDTAQQVMVSEQAEAMHILTEQALPRHHQGMPQQVPAQQFIPPNILQQQPTVLDYAGTKNDSTAMSPPIYVTIGRQVADEQSTETDGQISWECLHDYNDLAPPLLPGSPPHCGASFASALSLLTHFCSQHRPVALGSAPLWTWCGGCGPTRGSSLTDTRCGQCGVIGGSRELWLYCMPVVPEDKLRFLLHDEARLMAEALDMATMMGSECADQVGPWHHNVGLASPEPVLLPDLVSSGTSTASSPTSMIGYASSAASSAALSSRNSSVATLVTGSASFGAAAGAGGDFGSGSAGVNAGDVPAYEKPDGAIGGGQQQHHQYHQHQVSAGEQTIEAERHLQQHYQHQQHCHYQQQHQQDQHQYESHQRQQPCQDPMQDRMHDMPSNGAQQTPNM